MCGLGCVGDLGSQTLALPLPEWITGRYERSAEAVRPEERERIMDKNAWRNGLIVPKVGPSLNERFPTGFLD